MVELIVVIVLIGIIGTVAVGRFMERSTFDTVAWADQVRSTLRFAQKVAIAQNSTVYVHVAPARVSVCLDRDAACARLDARVPAPGGANSGAGPTRDACGSDNWMCEAPPAGVRMHLPENATATGAVAFDGMGRGASVDGFGGKLEIAGEGIVQTVAIDPETGYVD